MGVEEYYPTVLFDGVKVQTSPCSNCGKVIYYNTIASLWLHIGTGDRKCTFLAEPRPR